MPVTATIFATRKPGMTPAAFKKHYEEVHVPLVKSIAGPLFPESHRRFYIARTPTSETDASNAGHPASVLVGTQDKYPFDAYTHLTFTDMEAFQKFMGVVSQPENAAKVAEDEKLFLAEGTMTAALIDDIQVTT